VSTVDRESRDSGWLDWIERGTVSWDDEVAWSYSGITILEWNMLRAG
jgi:hypothetical protein